MNADIALVLELVIQALLSSLNGSDATRADPFQNSPSEDFSAVAKRRHASKDRWKTQQICGAGSLAMARSAADCGYS